MAVQYHRLTKVRNVGYLMPIVKHKILLLGMNVLGSSHGVVVDEESRSSITEWNSFLLISDV